MEKTNYFVEGLQGAGKTTFVRHLSNQLKEHKVFYEGDFSPVELAWCAYVTEEQYSNILEKYSSLQEEIRGKTVTEEAHKIICYTQIITDVPGFHKDLEKYEIYNGNLDKASFEAVVLERFGKWNGGGQIFECSIFQNIMENQMLYLQMTEDEILDFYRRLKNVLADKLFRIIYLDVEDIEEVVAVIRRERSDKEGKELWFPLMLRYLEESPYGREHRLAGLTSLLDHLAKRRALEHRIMKEVFPKNAVILKAKNYGEIVQ